MARNQKKIKSLFGDVVRRGDVVNINLRIAAVGDSLPVDMRVSVNTKSGRVIGDAKSVLAFVEHIQIPIMDVLGLVMAEGGGRKASNEEVAHIEAQISHAIQIIDQCTKQADAFAGAIGEGEKGKYPVTLDYLMDGLEHILKELETEWRESQEGGQK